MNHDTSECRVGTNRCFWCGDPSHLIANCPARTAQLNKGPAPLKSSKAPIPTTSRQVGRSYVINKKQADGVTTIVTGTLTLNSIPLTVLFDSGATHSFISSHAAAQIQGKVNACPIDLHVELATGS